MMLLMTVFMVRIQNCRYKHGKVVELIGMRVTVAVATTNSTIKIKDTKGAVNLAALSVSTEFSDLLNIPKNKCILCDVVIEF